MMNTKQALVIGNNDYQDSKLSKLTAPVEDVSGLVEVLRDPEICGFDEVTHLTDANSATALRSIAAFFARKNREDLLLLYFSGHGVLDAHGHLYLAFKDTEYDLLSGTAIPANFITQEMDRCRSQRQVLILDCCHSGAFSRGSKSALGARVGVASAFEGNGFGRVVLTASDSTQFALQGNELIGEAENSLFTHYLIEGLRTGKADLNTDGTISLDELYDYVFQRILQHTPNQTPGKWHYRKKEDLFIAKNPGAIKQKAASSQEDQAARATTAEAAPSMSQEEENVPMQPNTKAKGAMNEKASPRSSRTALAAIVFLIVIAAGWLFFQYGSGNGQDNEASSTRQEMLARKAEAENANAPSIAEGAYHKALVAAEQGEQEYEDGNFTAAKLSFSMAAELFGQAAREASENPDAAQLEETEEEQSRLEQPALSARTEMRNLKNQAVSDRAQSLASGTFEAASQKERQAEQELEAEDYTRAESSFNKASELFKKSRNEAQNKALGEETDLNAMRSTVESRKQEMLREKAAAEDANARTMAPELFENARQKEQAGDRSFRAATKSGYLAAQSAYAEAKDGYHDAAEAAINKANEEAIKAKQREAALKEEETRAKLRNKAEAARSAMEEARRQVPGSAADKGANPAYQSASRVAAVGDEQFAEGKFEPAEKSYQMAKNSYAQASGEIADALNSEKAKASEQATSALAESEIQGLINSYMKSLEREDIDNLKTFDKNLNEREWERVFRNADDVSVSILEKNIQVSGNSAQATFRLNMSFFNTSQNRAEKYPIAKVWRLERRNGQWKVVESK